MERLDAFAGVRALSFDCYGTLIDWERGIADELEPWASRHGVDASREELLEVFGGIETGIQREHPPLRYPDVLGRALRAVAADLGVAVSPSEADAFGASVGRWPAFADSPGALARLQQRFKLIVLSNVDRESFAASAERLGVEFDLVITAEDVGSYKPDTRNFAALLDALATIDLDRSQLVHVAQSLYHDHEPAKAAGLRTVWIDRRHDRTGFGATPGPASQVEPDWTFESMDAFAAFVAG